MTRVAHDGDWIPCTIRLKDFLSGSLPRPGLAIRYRLAAPAVPVMNENGEAELAKQPLGEAQELLIESKADAMEKIGPFDERRSHMLAYRVVFVDEKS